MRAFPGISGAVLNMDPVPSHNIRVYLHNLPLYGDFLFVQGGCFREKFFNRVTVLSGRLFDVMFYRLGQLSFSTE